MRLKQTVERNEFSTDHKSVERNPDVRAATRKYTPRHRSREVQLFLKCFDHRVRRTPWAHSSRLNVYMILGYVGVKRVGWCKSFVVHSGWVRCAFNSDRTKQFSPVGVINFAGLLPGDVLIFFNNDRKTIQK